MSMYNHSPKDDAHKQSNSKEKWINDIKVVVDLNGRVSPETVNDIITCIKTGKIFVLHNGIDQLFYYNPLNNWGQWKTTDGKKTDFKFDDIRALIKSVQLSLITLPKLIIPKVDNPAAGPRVKQTKHKLVHL